MPARCQMVWFLSETKPKASQIVASGPVFSLLRDTNPFLFGVKVATLVQMSLVSKVTCEPWQELRPLPNTRPNSSHYGINLGCARCGALVLRDEEIVAIKNGSLWTKSPLEFACVSESKNCSEVEVRCEECNSHIGTHFLRRPASRDPSMDELLSTITFPASKIMYLRQSSSGNLFNKTILLGEEDIIRKGISNLQLPSNCSLPLLPKSPP